jgi:hypothetical protein
VTVYAHGFDYLSTAELAEYWDTVDGGGTVTVLSATAARDGSQGMRVTGLGAGWKVYFPSGQNQMWAGVSFQYVGTPGIGSANILVFLDSTGFPHVQCSVGVNASGQLEVSQADRGTVVATSTQTITAGTWYSIQVRAFLPGGIGSDEMEVLVDDGTGPVRWLNVVGTFRWQSNTDLCGIRVGNGGGGAPDYRYDNLYVSNEGFKGDLRVTTLYPNGAGSNAGWTTQVGGVGGPFTAVNETPNDDDTSYLKTGTVSALHTLAMQDLGTTPPSISFVQAVACLRQEAAATVTVAPVLNSSSSPLIGAFKSPGTSYKYYAVSSTTDPATLAPWTLAGVNAVECGMKAGAAGTGNVRCTQVVLEVQCPNPAGAAVGGAVVSGYVLG